MEAATLRRTRSRTCSFSTFHTDCQVGRIHAEDGDDPGGLDFVFLAEMGERDKAVSRITDW